MGNKLYFMSGNNASEMTEQFFKKEVELQEIVEKNPNLLSRALEDGEGSKIYLIDREYGIAESDKSSNAFSLDHLMVDENGFPILVEVKRSTDTRIRREVVAQMLDYACRASSWDADDLREKFHVNNPDEADMFNDDELWGKVAANLKAEHMRLVFVADRIPDSLQVLIEFMDRSLKDIEVYGVELKPYKTNDNSTLLLSSNFIGNSPLSSPNKPTIKNAGFRWTEETFLDRVSERMGLTVRDIASSIIDFCATSGLEISFGTGAKKAAFNPRLDGSIVFRITQLYSSTGDFVVEFTDTCINALPSEAATFDNVRSELNELHDTGFLGDFKSTDRTIWLGLDLFKSPAALDSLKKIISFLI